YKVKNADAGIERAVEIVRYGGMGHSSVVHSTNQDVINKFASQLQTGRVIVNAPSTHGAIGDLYNTNLPSLTLGCGSFGSNSTTSNVSAVNLANIKRVAYRTTDMQCFNIPPKTYFQRGSTHYLEKMPDISRVLLVTDEMMVKLGYVER